MRRARTALITVFNKSGIADFAKGLQAQGIRIFSSKGTARYFREAGIEVAEISELTGVPEALDGRLKTIHPRVHAGILAERNSEAHRLELERNGWDYIDIVVVNLPPLQVGKTDDLKAIMDRMDIGGHALLRSAAKNFRDVVVVCSPARYKLVLEELKSGEGVVSEGLRARLAREALETVASYDAAFHSRLYKMLTPAQGVMPSEFKLDFSKVDDLRYGENPHQRAAIYKGMDRTGPSVLDGVQLNGKALSYNNYLDLNAALDIVREFRNPACAIVKHANPCGVAVADNLPDAYKKARATDPESAFGGIVGLNATVGKDLAAELASTFIECIIAPSYEDAAIDILREKKSLRVLKLESLLQWMGDSGQKVTGYEFRQVSGGLLAQERDLSTIGLGDLKHVTERKPLAKEAGEIFFAWTVVRHVRSNAIVIATADETVGIGAGQMSRVDACRLAVSKAQKPIEGCIAASDGFFPFRDGIEELARAGVKTIVQPGGSKRDDEVIAACNELGVAMVFTGMRCFKH